KIYANQIVIHPAQCLPQPSRATHSLPTVSKDRFTAPHAMGGLFAAWIVDMGSVSVIESFPVDVLRVGRKMSPHGGREICVGAVRHSRASRSKCYPCFNL